VQKTMTTYTIKEMHTYKTVATYNTKEEAQEHKSYIWKCKAKGEILNGVYIVEQ
jgi:hypothetical protein